MNKIVDTLIVAAMLLTSVPSLADGLVLVEDAAAQTQEAAQEQPEGADDKPTETP